MTDTLRLIVDFDPDSGWHFVVKEGQDTLIFRPGFRSREDAEQAGDAWLRAELDATPEDTRTD